MLPSNVDLSVPSPIEFAEYLVKTYLQAYGFTSLKQVMHLKTSTILRKNVEHVFNSMLQQRTIQKVEGNEFSSVFVQSNLIEKKFHEIDPSLKLLSPFDNSIIHRERLTHFFGFDYRLECYLPKEKRQFGYFCLPILFGDRFIGRADCKAHRKEKKFEIIHLHIENEHTDIELWGSAFIQSVKKFAEFNGCNSVVFTQVSPLKIAAALNQLLKKVF